MNLFTKEKVTDGRPFLLLFPNVLYFFDDTKSEFLQLIMPFHLVVSTGES